LAIVFQMKDEVGRLVRMISEKNLVEGAAKKVIIKLKKWMKTRKSFNVNKFVESLPEELGAVVDQAYLTDLGEMSSNLSKLEKELNGALEVLEKMAVKTKLRELTEEIKQAEKEKDEALLGKLQAKFVEVSRGFKL